MADLTLPDISKFTPNEQAALQYHRNHLLTGSALKHDDGSMTTFMGTVVDTPKGGAMILPTYWNGAVREVPDAMNLAVKSGIKFPIYPSVKAALAAEQRMHKIMEQDVNAYMGQKK
jgi:hypothetical protein